MKRSPPRKETLWHLLRRGSRQDSGAATVLVLGCVAVLAMLAAGWLAVGRAALTRQRAETAADLAALAGAGAVQRGVDGCQAASVTAARNGAQLLACLRAGDDVLVSVQVRASVTASAQARAGPAQVAAEAG